MLIALGIFSHLLKINDALIGAISTSTNFLSCFVYAFAVVGWQLFLGPVVDIFGAVPFTSFRTIISKLVPVDEIGTVTSFFIFCESFVPIGFTPIYVQIYQATITSMPGAFFLFGGALMIPVIAVFL